MAKISIDDIKKLRELTGVGISDAKQALVESDGDFDKALAAMRDKSLAKAAKRTERETWAGLIATYSHDGRIGVVVEVNCETDFVAKTDEFKELVKDLTLQIAASEAEDVKALTDEPFVRQPDVSVGDYVKEHIAKLGENIVIRRFARMVLGEVNGE
ncbi:TPA: translation elongation factor Ts [Candidatus Saccharibacteria bacterium]|nr:MAG: translation elongation factor Ts [Candidatus Saccharibacteria bacterium RIFCSPHIGHO2_12_FULL_47_17]HCM51875.1 translation elongation factor Ts [Candidatus Saccharibacteria bacterium]